MKKITYLFLLISFYTHAQKTSFKFGKVSAEELKMSECAFFEEADAMVLGRIGRLRFKNENQGFIYEIEITKRIKIFNTEGKDYANISLIQYDPTEGIAREELSQIQGMTYNLVDGKVVKTKLEKNQIFESRLSDFRKEVSFALPNVKDGSVVEFKYIQRSHYLGNLYTWVLQEDLPVAFSQFTYTLPDFFEYRQSILGTSLDIKSSSFDEVEDFHRGFQAMSRTQTSKSEELKSFSTTSTIEATDIPPILDEPYMNNKVDIPTRLEFQLESRDFPGYSFSTARVRTYADFNKQLLESGSLGGAMKRNGFAKDKVKSLEGTDLEKATEIYNWIQGNFAWNNVLSIGSSRAGGAAFKEKKGSTADINLTLGAALRRAGLQAFPVLISTRGHGTPHPSYPSYNDFNSVVIATIIGEKIILADAASDLPFGMLPNRCLNGRGWLVNDPEGMWVNLKSHAKITRDFNTSIAVENGQLVTDVKARYADYGFIPEKRMLNSEGEEAYKHKITDRYFTDMEIGELNIQNNPKDLRWSVRCMEALDDDQTIYLNPVRFGAINDNPFKREERNAPVDFSTGQTIRLLTTIRVPEGYQAELPKPAVISLPEGAAKFTYAVRQSGQMINISSSFIVNQTDFGSDNYAYIRQFYQLVSEKHQEPVILKKI
ncbi:MAG: DUF3857 and transglutaminase domain-containing protein [Cytophagales bacterium]|nr:DUF3857 and transglutaminase domain-containing protein [Cytophagales bacterium]